MLIVRIMSFNLRGWSSSSRITRQSARPSVSKIGVANPRQDVVLENTERSRGRFRLGLNGTLFRDHFAVVEGAVPRRLESEGGTVLENWLQQNLTRLQFIFFGTSTRLPTIDRHLPSLAVRSTSELWLFDVGEDTQRQCMKHPLTRARKICRIFITSLEIDTCFGLPGALCTIAASREKNLTAAEVPIHVYGPKGIASFVMKLMEISDTFLSTPVLIHEFSNKAQAKSFKKLTNRAKLWKVSIPPDGFNEEGFYDARMDRYRLMKRKLMRSKPRPQSIDYRTAFRPFQLPSAEDPTGPHRTANSELRWTLKLSNEFLIEVYPLDDKGLSLGYRIIEADSAGKLDIAKAMSYGIQPGPEYGLLKRGGTVTNQNGDSITSEMVLEPDKKGRVISILGQSKDAVKIKEASFDADYLILHVSRDPVNQTSDGLTPEQLVELASSSRVKNLIFGRVDDLDIKTIKSLSSPLSNSDRMNVILAFDLYTYVVATH